jgi:hypothetical protein
LQDSHLINQSRRSFRFLFRLYNTRALSIWNSYALICKSIVAAIRNLRALKGAVMKTIVKTGRAQSDQGKSPFSTVACLVLLLFAGILVKFAALTSIFHFVHWN